MKFFKLVYTFAYIEFFAVVAFASDNNAESKMLGAYEGGQYLLAAKFASECKDSPKAKLVCALCKVYDQKRQNLSVGFSELTALYEDPKMPVDIRLIAGISCARGAQALNMRNGLYPAAEAVDYVSIYKQIMKNYPDSSSAVYSLMYLGQELFDSNSDEKVTEAFKMFNDFITSYHGNRLYLSPLHLMLADQYIIHRVEYDKAVKHLEECYKIGIANPKNRESAIYRIARIYESRLKSRKNAIKWYRLYLKEYPNSSNSALVKRYLKEMNVKSIEETNG